MPRSLCILPPRSPTETFSITVQLVKDEEFLGGLISANDQIILSLELYDKLSKAADVDSDEEEPLANIRGGKSAVERANARAEAEEAEIELVQRRLADAHLGEGQLEALQDKQRMRIERHNSHRSQSVRSEGGDSVQGGSGHIKDLMDINFDDDDGQSRTVSSTSRPSNQGASLSDYSDYESESDEETHRAARTGTDKYGRSQYDDGEDEDSWAPITNHQPNIGPDSLLQDDDDDDDPFADPRDRLESFTPLRASGRQEFAAV